MYVCGIPLPCPVPTPATTVLHARPPKSLWHLVSVVWLGWAPVRPRFVQSHAYQWITTATDGQTPMVVNCHPTTLGKTGHNNDQVIQGI